MISKKLKEYQKEKSDKAYKIVMATGMVYIAMEVRTGKTAVSLDVARKLCIDDKTVKGNKEHFNNVIFVTTKKSIGTKTALGSIISDYKDFGFQKYFNIFVVNYESLHKGMGINAYGDMVAFPLMVDAIIFDEAHKLGTYPIPSDRFMESSSLCNRYKYARVIYLSGTPTPESYSQIYHQIQVTKQWSPYSDNYPTFYKWAKEYVNIKDKYVATGQKTNDYSEAKDNALDFFNLIKVTCTQKEAGFENTIIEQVVKVKMQKITSDIINKLRKDKVVQGKSGVILGDTPVKLMSKVHQLSSGSVILEPDVLEPESKGKKLIIDNSKMDYIKENYVGKKIAIIYVYDCERQMIENYFSSLTQSPEEFRDNDDKIFYSQIRSVREGVNLSSADYLIMLNIEYSAVSYLQGRDRMTSMTRKKDNNVIWLFSDCGIEHQIYQKVIDKEDFTTKHFLMSQK